MNDLRGGGPATPVSIALVHHPVYNRRKQTVTTSITSVDIHDIARSARTFGVSPYYMVTPIAAQRLMLGDIAEHWVSGSGTAKDHPRVEAMAQIRVVESIDSAVADFERIIGSKPLIAVTGASLEHDVIKFSALRTQIFDGKFPGVLILFGTGWGLTNEVTALADLRVEPISGWTDYRHLSVRSAVAITLDRLLGIRL